MENKLKPTIRLYDAVGLGLIINHHSGILFINQTGGTACLQSSMEGIYMPLRNDYLPGTLKLISPEVELTAYFIGEKYVGTGATHGIDDEDAEHIAKILGQYGLGDFIEIDKEKLKQSHEAWINVIINDDKHIDLLSNFGKSLKGVLTWGNSD